MRKIIHNLRNQPEPIRRNILHLLVLLSSVVLIALWVMSLSKNLSSTETKNRMEQDLVPFTTFKNSIVGENANNSAE